MRVGFPHSEICGSKLVCQLPAAYRRLRRPSSPVIAKASTMCTYSLVPITLAPADTGSVIEIKSTARCMFVDTLITTLSVCFRIRLKNFTSSRLLKNRTTVVSKRLNVNLNQELADLCLGFLVEDDGIEPTTPCLQSRCSPS